MVDTSNSYGAAIRVPFRRALCGEGAVSSALVIEVIGQPVAVPYKAPNESPKDWKYNLLFVSKFSRSSQ